MFEPGDPVGRVVFGGSTPSFSECEVILQTGVTVRPGELLQVELAKGSHYLICRVEEGQEINPYERPETARIRDLVGLESIAAREDMPRKYRIARADNLEEMMMDAGSSVLREPQTVPPAGSPVFRVSAPAVAAALGLPPDGGNGGSANGDPPGPDGSGGTGTPPKETAPPLLRIGATVGGASIPLALDPQRTLPRHVLVVGTTGTGKSYFKGVLMEEVKAAGIPQVSLDVHGESVKATAELGGRTMIPGRDLTVPLSALSEPEVLGLMPWLTELQEGLVRRAFNDLKRSHRPFGVEDLVAKIHQIGPRISAKPTTIEAAAMRSGSLRDVKIIGPGVDWGALLRDGAIVNIDCRTITHSELQAIAGAVARDLATLRQREQIPPLVLHIDEAHIFLPHDGESASAGVLREVIRMGRHYGLCLVLVTPSPTDIDRRIVRTTNTRFIFACEPEQLDALKGVFADAPKELIARIPKMEQGVCLLAGSRETIRHAVLVKIRARRTTHGGDTPDIVRQARSFVAAPLPEAVPEASPADNEEDAEDLEEDAAPAKAAPKKEWFK
ncbi:MAG: ATP-binding protein [Thermoplasmatota archaeon]